MKKVSTQFLASLLSLTTLQAEGMKCGAGKCGASMGMEQSATGMLADIHTVDGYTVMISSKKPLVTGNNDLTVTLEQEGREVTDAKVKVKFFMPEMPGMPYMEHEEKFALEGNTYKGVINFSMGGTWQYHLKFKTADGEVHKTRGSVNL